MSKEKAPGGAIPIIQVNNTTADRLLSILTIRPQSRRVLAERLHTSDRGLRKAVMELRKRGYPVCSNSHADGYWIGTKEDVRRTVAEYRRRANESLLIARKMEQWQLDGQEAFDDLFN